MTTPDVLDGAEIERAVAGLSEVQIAVLFALKLHSGKSAQKLAYEIGRRPSRHHRFAIDRVALSLCSMGLAHWIRSRDDQWGIRLFFPNERGCAIKAHLACTVCSLVDEAREHGGEETTC